MLKYKIYTTPSPQKRSPFGFYYLYSSNIKSHYPPPPLKFNISCFPVYNCGIVAGSEALMKVPGPVGRTGIKIEYFRLPNWNSILSPSFGHSTIYVRTSIAKIDILETTIWLLALSWKNLTYISYIVIYNIYSYISIYNYIFLEFLRSQFLFFLHS